MRKVLVSGGADLIGSHLYTYLIRSRHKVICLDNLSTGSGKNIAHLKGNSRFEFVHHGAGSFYKAEADEIYSLTCSAFPVHHQHDAVEIIKTSVLGTINMLGLAKGTNAKIMRVLISEIHGDSVVRPQVKNYWGSVSPIGIRSCYDEGRRCAEILFMGHHHQNGIRIKAIRIFDIYGPRMLSDNGRVVSNPVVQALQNEDITIYDSGTQARSFQHVDDLIEGAARMMDTRDELIGLVNLSSPYEFSILELVEKVIKLAGSELKLTFRPLSHDDPKQCRPDITLAKSKLKW